MKTKTKNQGLQGVVPQVPLFFQSFFRKKIPFSTFLTKTITGKKYSEKYKEIYRKNF